MDMKNIGDNCTQCGRSTALGSGLFVNRIPSITDTEEGYMCPECQQVECDSCGNLTLSYIVTESGLWVCENCWVEETMAKAKALGITGKALDDMQHWLTKMAKDAASSSLDMSHDEEIDGLLRREG